MARPRSSDTHYPCGHERSAKNTVTRKDGVARCRACKNAQSARYYQTHAAYFHDYRRTHADYFAAYRKAWWHGGERPKVKDIGLTDGSAIVSAWRGPDA